MERDSINYFAFLVTLHSIYLATGVRSLAMHKHNSIYSAICLSFTLHSIRLATK